MPDNTEQTMIDYGTQLAYGSSTKNNFSSPTDDYNGFSSGLKQALQNIDDADSSDGKKQPSLVDQAFLNTLNFAHRIGAVDGTAYKLFDQIVVNGRREPITEKDFQPNELDAIRSLITDKIAKTGQTSGHIDYADYPGGNLQYANRTKAHTEILNSLGGFDYKTNEDGSLVATDHYGFNTNRAGPGEDNPVIQALGAIFNPRNFAAHIGRERVPKNQGSDGVPVNIQLGKS